MDKRWIHIESVNRKRRGTKGEVVFVIGQRGKKVVAVKQCKKSES